MTIQQVRDSIHDWHFFFFIFSHFYVGSMCLVRRLHLGRSCASSPDNPLSDKSFLMLSNHLRYGLPLLLFPGTSILTTLLPTYSSSLLETCPYHFNLLFFIFSYFYVGLMCLVRRLHVGRSCTSSPDNPLSDKSFLMLSNHLRFGIPLLLFPGTSILITLLPTYSSSLLETCPYHFNLLSCTFFLYFSHFCRPSNSFIPNSVHLGDSTHPS